MTLLVDRPESATTARPGPAPQVPAQASPGTARTGSRSLLALVPRGARLDEASFRARHTALTWVLLAHVPVLAGLALLWSPEAASSHHDAPGHTHMDLGMAWVGIAAMLVLAAVGRVARGQTMRAAAVGSGLALSSATLVHLSGGMTDMHLHFFVTVAAVALYQQWVPFVLSILVVAAHHIGMSLADPAMVFSDPRAQANPIAFSLLHAGLLLAECVALAASWRFTESAEAERRDVSARAERVSAERLDAQTALAEEQARTAAAAQDELDRRRARAVLVEEKIADAGRRRPGARGRCGRGRADHGRPGGHRERDRRGRR